MVTVLAFLGRSSRSRSLSLSLWESLGLSLSRGGARGSLSLSLSLDRGLGSLDLLGVRAAGGVARSESVWGVEESEEREETFSRRDLLVLDFSLRGLEETLVPPTTEPVSSLASSQKGI